MVITLRTSDKNKLIDSNRGGKVKQSHIKSSSTEGPRHVGLNESQAVWIVEGKTCPKCGGPVATNGSRQWCADQNNLDCQWGIPSDDHKDNHKKEKKAK